MDNNDALQTFIVDGEEIHSVPLTLGRFKTLLSIIARTVRQGAVLDAILHPATKTDGAEPAAPDNTLLFSALENLSEDDIATMISCCVDRDAEWVKVHFRMGWAMSALVSTFLAEGMDLGNVLRSARAFAGPAIAPTPSPT